MSFPEGIEFVVSDQVPPEMGLRRLNQKTFEIHPQLYGKLLQLFEDKEKLARAIATLGKAFRLFSQAMGQLGELFDELNRGEMGEDKED
jgi:hypothetical protein